MGGAAFGIPEHAFQSGSCIVCGHGTDTGIGIAGEPEWIAAGLINLGIPTDQAVAIVETYVTEVDATGRAEWPVRICADCTPGRFPRPVLLIPGAAVPSIRQPEEAQP